MLLTLPLESELIWKNLKSRFSATTRGFYFVCRYGVLVDSILYVLVSLPSTNHSKTWCIGLYAPVIVMTLCIEASGHCITLFAIFVLWERNTKIKRIMILVTATSYIVAFAMLIKFLRPVVENTYFESTPSNETQTPIRACADVFDPKLSLGFWTPAVFIDGCAIVLLWWNALDQPRSANVRVIKLLERDGIVLLLAGFCLRLSNILITSTASFAVVLFAGINLEFVNAVLNVHLFLQLHEASRRRLSDEHIYNPDDNNSKPSLNIPLRRLPHVGEQTY